MERNTSALSTATLNQDLPIYFTDRRFDASMLVQLRAFGSVTFSWQMVTTNDTRESTQLEAVARADGYNVVCPYNLFDVEVLFVDCTLPQLRQLQEKVLQRIENRNV